jgi:hypothetical protein
MAPVSCDHSSPDAGVGGGALSEFVALGARLDPTNEKDRVAGHDSSSTPAATQPFPHARWAPGFVPGATRPHRFWRWLEQTRDRAAARPPRVMSVQVHKLRLPWR